MTEPCSVNPLTAEEFEISLSEMKNGKSAGPGDIPIELVKHGLKILFEELKYLMNLLLVQDQDVPSKWNTGQVFPI